MWPSFPACLSGVRAFEACSFVAGPLCGMTLAQMGADVIRVDPIGGAADYRRLPLSAAGTSVYWSSLNKGKRSVVLNLRRREGQELLTALLASRTHDPPLFLSNSPATGWRSYDALAGERRDLIYLSISGSPDRPTAVDYTVNAECGIPFLTGPEGGGLPVNHALPAWDLLTGLYATTAILGALLTRSTTGHGSHISLSLAEVAFATVANLGLLAEVEVLGLERPALGNYVYGAFARDFATADDYRLMVVAITSNQWRALVKATGTSDQMQTLETARHVSLQTDQHRYAERHAIAAILEPWFASKTIAEAEAILSGYGACWGRYQTLGSLLTDPRISSSSSGGLFEDVAQPGLGLVRTPTAPFRFDGLRVAPPAAAPVLGEHTDSVLSEVLGLTPSELGRLHDEGIVGANSGRGSSGPAN